MTPSISFIILDYLKAEKVIQNISGIIDQNIASPIEIIIGDNSECGDNTAILKTGIEKIQKKLQKIKREENVAIFLHIFKKNEGYSKGNNYLIQKSKGEYICILNPDIEWEDRDTMKKLITHIENNTTIGIIAPRQTERTGKDALSIRAFPSFITQVARRTFLRHIAPFSKAVEKDEMTITPRHTTQEVDWVQSSFLVISKKTWIQLEGFDERFFLFLADTDLCKKAWDQQKTVVHFGETTVFSDGIRCSEGGILAFFTSKTLRIHVLDSIKYFWKQYWK